MEACKAILHHVAALSGSDEFTDVVLVARTEDGTSKDLPSHLCILARSPVFKRMFSGTFAESTLKRVEIPVANTTHLELLRAYLYTDKFEYPSDWAANDSVELMALCDKYEVPPAFDLVSGEFLNQLGELDLTGAEESVMRLSSAIGREAFVHDALAKLVHKVVFGSQLMQFLVWLRQFHRLSGLPIQAQQKSCLQAVSIDQAALERELAVDHAEADEVDVMRARMLMTTSFLEKVSASLETTTFANGIGHTTEICSSRSCYQRNRVQVTVSTTAEINTVAKPKLSFGIGRLMEDMDALFAGRAQSVGGNPDCVSAKRQKTS